MSKVIGIDISKQTFDVSWKEKGKTISVVFDNNQEGFVKFAKHLHEGDHCVMEASGTYYLKLAMFLHHRKVHVSVMNPLVIRRYCQMEMSRTKTDKKDAIMICEYALLKNPPYWEPEKSYIMEMNDVLGALEMYEKMATQLSNQLEAESKLPVVNKIARKSREATLKQIHQQVDKLMAELESIAEKNCAENLRRLKTIPGIGSKTAIVLIAITGNFEYFEDVRALCAYCGLSPRIFKSGSSVKGKEHICKIGNARVRKLLYMCSWSAQTANAHCKELQQRLQAKNKPKKVINIALANKLLRIAFGVVKRKEDYNKTKGLKQAA